MTSAPAILSIEDETEWHADSLPTIDVALRSCIYGTPVVVARMLTATGWH